MEPNVADGSGWPCIGKMVFRTGLLECGGWIGVALCWQMACCTGDPSPMWGMGWGHLVLANGVFAWSHGVHVAWWMDWGGLVLAKVVLQWTFGAHGVQCGAWVGVALRCQMVCCPGDLGSTKSNVDDGLGRSCGGKLRIALESWSPWSPMWWMGWDGLALANSVLHWSPGAHGIQCGGP